GRGTSRAACSAGPCRRPGARPGVRTARQGEADPSTRSLNTEFDRVSLYNVCSSRAKESRPPETAMQEPSPNKNRETALALALLLALAGAFFFLLNFFFGGIFTIALVLIAMAIVGYLHYVWWGHAFSQDTAGEREEELARQRFEAEQYDRDRAPI